MSTSTVIDKVFQTHFASIGSSVTEEQRTVIDAVLAGNNTLALMPTGSGKSLCYWVAGKALGGITLVVFPLTALMDEQERKLTNHGCNVLKLHSGVDSRTMYSQLINLYRGQNKPDFIFVSPERIATDGFLEFILRHVKDDIKLVTIDEAHCISQWGLNFRPFYKEIPYFLDDVFGANNHPLILCLTATLNPKECEDICRDFSISPKYVIKSEMLLRHKINLQVVKVSDEKEKDKLFWEIIKKSHNEKVLVYIENKYSGEHSTEGLCEQAIKKGFAAAYFHADLSVDEKQQVIDDFKSDKVSIVFATSAFGMGIDIPDIRGVIHYRPPESTEQYYQQIGRVGRDNKPAWALMYYTEKNISIRRNWFIQNAFPTADNIKQAFKDITGHKIGRRTVSYFTDTEIQKGYHYLIRSQIIQMVCKAMAKLDIFEAAKNISLPEFKRYQQASKTGLVVLIAHKLQIPESEIMENIYRWLAEGKIKTNRLPDKRLVVEAVRDILPDDFLEQIMDDVATKKEYIEAIFDEFVEILSNYKGSKHLHQAIGEYLGVDKWQLNKIHDTDAGIKVRSKSEVIIANLLVRYKIPFEYELPLKIPGLAKPISPDFTIDWKNKRYYWEHWGMYSDQSYRSDMYEKKALYEQHYPGQLLETYDVHTLTNDAKKIIQEHFTK